MSWRVERRTLCVICGHPLPPPPGHGRGRPRDCHAGPCAEVQQRLNRLEALVEQVDFTPGAARELRRRLVTELVNRVGPLYWERPRGLSGRFCKASN